MTINYSKHLEKGRKVDIFYRLLKLWKGSLYKLIWVDLICYLVLFYAINFTYRFALNQKQRKKFVKMIQFADEMKESIPFYFILGFFVAGIIGRWFRIFLLIPWLHRQAFIFESNINGNGVEKSLRLRRTLLRYLNLAWILQMRIISEQIATRFRNQDIKKSKQINEFRIRDMFDEMNQDQMIQSTYGKIITDAEIRVFESFADGNSEYVPEYWIPIQWASRIIQKSYTNNYLPHPGCKDDLIKELDKVRNNMQELQVFSQITIPLVYTQVVIIAVYSFFICELLGAQLISPSEKVVGHEVDTYFPFFPVFEFLFLMGWLKVALCVMNPFGDDEEDFQTSNILDYNLDSTFRTVSSDAEMFPDKLDRPQMIYQLEETFDSDELEIFLDKVDFEIKMADSNKSVNNLVYLEMKPSMSNQILECLHPKRGKRKQKIKKFNSHQEELLIL